MKRLIAATLLALAAAPVFANDVASVIPAAPAAGSDRAVVMVATASPFGSADITSVIPQLPLARSASTGPSRPDTAQSAAFGNADITSVVK